MQRRNHTFHSPGPWKLALGLMLTGACAAWAAVDPYAAAPSYLAPVAAGVRVQPFLTVGQTIPQTGGGQFLVRGIPDGLGLSFGEPGQGTLLSNHEFTQTAGAPAGPLPSGARISAFKLQATGNPQLTAASGEYAIDEVRDGSGNVVPPGSAAFSRFCSSFLADGAVGFDRPIYLTGEESGSLACFDGKGGVGTALTPDGVLHVLPALGHFEKENLVVLPFTGQKTVIFATEDGPSTGDRQNSQLYMYVGTKNPASRDALVRNGLVGGKLYVATATDPNARNEGTFTSTGANTQIRWTEVDPTLIDTALDTQAKSLDSFNFVRLEDCAASPKEYGKLYFDTTGSDGSPNRFGRLYSLVINPANPTAGGFLKLLYSSAGQANDLISPDNIAIRDDLVMMVCEDPNYNLSAIPVTAGSAQTYSLGRDSSVFRIDLKTMQRTRVLEIDRATAISHALAADGSNTVVASSNTPGGWETSGVINAGRLLTPDWWIIDVQAHSLRINPVGETVEGGQYLAFFAH